MYACKHAHYIKNKLDAYARRQRLILCLKRPIWSGVASISRLLEIVSLLQNMVSFIGLYYLGDL